MSRHLNIIDFMGWRKLSTAFSVLVILVSLVSFAVNGMRFGMDFTGGTQIELHYPAPVQLPEVRTALQDAGFENFAAQHFGSDSEVLVRIQDATAAGTSEESQALGEEVAELLSNTSGQAVSLARAPDFIGSVVGDELREQGGLGMLVALGTIMIYIALRFQFKFAVGAVVSLVHDVVFTLGFFSLFNLEFDLTTLAAILAVIGYSLNDTIVVADRIRENFRLMRQMSPVEIINASITQTFDRTLITSATTVFVVIALFFFGGDSVHGFATALLVGIVVGTYSSIYVAANILVYMHITKEDLMPPVKEGEEFESMP